MNVRDGKHDSLNLRRRHTRMLIGSYKDILEFMLEPEITAEAFLRCRQQPNPPLLLDVREPWEHQTAHLPDSLLMPMGDVPSRAHAELDPDASIVVLCHHGARSLNVTMWLRNQGFEHVQSLAGGIDGWSCTVDPTVPRY
jgi:rhodanese-related sulfurtransferase